MAITIHSLERQHIDGGAAIDFVVEVTKKSDWIIVESMIQDYFYASCMSISVRSIKYLKVKQIARIYVSRIWSIPDHYEYTEQPTTHRL